MGKHVLPLFLSSASGHNVSATHDEFTVHLQPSLNIPSRGRKGEPVVATIRAHDCSFVNSFQTITYRDESVAVGSHLVPSTAVVNDEHAQAAVRESNNSAIIGYQVYVDLATVTVGVGPSTNVAVDSLEFDAIYDAEERATAAMLAVNVAFKGKLVWRYDGAHTAHIQNVTEQSAPAQAAGGAKYVLETDTMMTSVINHAGVEFYVGVPDIEHTVVMLDAGAHGLTSIQDEINTLFLNSVKAKADADHVHRLNHTAGLDIAYNVAIKPNFNAGKVQISFPDDVGAGGAAHELLFDGRTEHRHALNLETTGSAHQTGETTFTNSTSPGGSDTTLRLVKGDSCTVPAVQPHKFTSAVALAHPTIPAGTFTVPKTCTHQAVMSVDFITGNTDAAAGSLPATHVVQGHITGTAPQFVRVNSGTAFPEFHSAIVGSAEGEHISVTGRFPNAHTVPIPQAYKVGTKVSTDGVNGHTIAGGRWSSSTTRRTVPIYTRVRRLICEGCFFP